jgi:hypothetical protein
MGAPFGGVMLTAAVPARTSAAIADIAEIIHMKRIRIRYFSYCRLITPG